MRINEAGPTRGRGGEQARTVSAGEEGLAAEHLSEHAADGPHVYGSGVLFEGEHDFGGAIPSAEEIVARRHEDRRVPHLVATYSVMNVLLSSTFGGGRADRASPKSQSWACCEEGEEGGGGRCARTTHLEIAICVQEEVRGLEVSVQNICRMKRLKSAEGLVLRISRGNDGASAGRTW